MYGSTWPFLLILIVYGPGVVFVKFGTGCHVIGTGCTLGRTPREKETLPDFHEWCRVTRHPRVFRGLTGYQRTPRIGASHNIIMEYFPPIEISSNMIQSSRFDFKNFILYSSLLVSENYQLLNCKIFSPKFIETEYGKLCLPS